MDKFFLFLFSCYGLTNIICISKIFKPIRIFFELRKNKLCLKIAELLNCPMCTGFWVGMIISYFMFKDNFFLLYAFASSGFVWVAHNFSELCYWNYESKN